jgi:hypothetical protein
MHFKKFEFILKKALAQDGCFDEKTEGRKSRDTVLLTVKSSFAFGTMYIGSEQQRT